MTTTSKPNGKSPAPKSNGKAEAEFTIAALARELRIDPRRARAALRKSDMKHTKGAAWVFKQSERDAVIAIIRSAD
jgi:hypothetical protein